jgi:hypothetical protein
MKRLSTLWILLLVSLISGSALPAANKNPDLVFVENAFIRVGINLKWGGAITHVSEPGGPNLINSYDLGRQIQQSYYSGPANYQREGKVKHKHWGNFPWNPIQTGDSHRIGSRVVEHRVKDGKLYVKTIPMLWPMKDDAAECHMETWIYLSETGPMFSYKAKLTNARSDHTQYGAHPQEIPAVYTNGPWHRLITYTGDKPFTGGATKEVRNDHKEPWPWIKFLATEGWTALLDDKGTGIGVCALGPSEFHAGFNGRRGTGGEKSTNTGYMSPMTREILDHNIEFEYACRFVLGNLQDIRNEAARITSKKLPRWNFKKSRHGWHYHNGSDDGWSLAGKGLKIKAKNPARPVRLLSPITFWQAKSARQVALEISSPTSGAITVYWRGMPPENVAEKPSNWGAWQKTWWNKSRSATTRITKGKSQWVKINLEEIPSYQGGITGLAIDVPDGVTIRQIHIEQ